MELTRLEIKGFKSFGDKVTIHFNQGVTAIVGPNGCGKSNVVDAIRWVLGEQSTKNLRSDKMENIIFNGTKKRKAANLAEVSLTFENSKNILPTEYTTVTITRKLYRSGESEYRLNDVKCRLKDIIDLFLDTGVGSDTYSIIELKMIDEIINNKDHSRRKLFEEAAGISKYKVRKKQTLQKLKDTEEDLHRVDDILIEIQKNLRSLEHQAKKADKYFRLKEQYKKVSLDLARSKIQVYSNQVEDIASKEQALFSTSSSFKHTIEEQEKNLQKLKEEVGIQEKNLSIQQKTTNEHIHKIRAYESEKKIKNEQMKFLQEKEARLKEEIAKDKQQLNHITYNLKRLNEDLYIEKEALDNQSSELDKNKLYLEELRIQQHTFQGKVDALKRKHQEKKQRAHEMEKDLAVLQIQLDALEQESSRNNLEASDKEQELRQFDQAILEVEARLETCSEQMEDLSTQETILQEQILSTKHLVDDTSAFLQQNHRVLDAKKNEYNLTKSLVDSLEGYPESIRFLRKTSNWKKAQPLLSDIIYCPEEYRVAVENYLEPWMNYYVVQYKQDALNAIKLLSDSSRGRANFFVLEMIDLAPEATSFPKQEGYIPALDVIHVDEPYDKLAKILLGNVLIATTEIENEATNPTPNNAVILHSEGKFQLSDKSLSGGSIGLFEGKRIGRVKNLERLSKEIKLLDKKLSEKEGVLKKGEEKLQELTHQSQKPLLDELKLEIQKFNNELLTLVTKREQHVLFIKSSNSRKIDIAAKTKEIQQKLQSTTPKLKTLKATINQEEQTINEQEAISIESSEELMEVSSAYNEQNLSFHKQKNKVESLQKDIEYRHAQHDSLEDRIRKNEKDYSVASQEISNALKFVDHNDSDLVLLYEQKNLYESGLKELEELYYSSRSKIQELENSLTDQRKQKEQTDLLLNELKDKKTQIQIDLNAMKERLSIEFNIAIENLIHDYEQSGIQVEGSQDDLQAQANQIKKQLESYGNINSMAKEAYDEMDERHTFITQEKEDLLEAKESLLATIKKIDQTANEKFMESFQAIRENFIHVFRSLFNEEDTCDLVIVDPKNPLESDIEIMARPKGKRPLSINQLSGGEKTLTSTALLFSLYLLKPAPFCIFDEVDAPLDDTNIDKFNNIIREFSNQSQFIVVSHNKRTIASTDVIYGVTMVEQGVSRVVAVDLRDVA